MTASVTHSCEFRAFSLEKSRVCWAKIKFEIKGAAVDVNIPEEAMMMEGLQIVKRSIANEIFKFVPVLEKVNFVDSFNKPKQEKPAEQKQEKPVQQKAA